VTNELYRLNTNLIPIDLNFNESGSILEVGKCLFVMSNLKTDSTYSIESCLVRTPDSTEMHPSTPLRMTFQCLKRDMKP